MFLTQRIDTALSLALAEVEILGEKNMSEVLIGIDDETRTQKWRWSTILEAFDGRRQDQMWRQ